jgi:hypothetical protein
MMMTRISKALSEGDSLMSDSTSTGRDHAPARWISPRSGA